MACTFNKVLLSCFLILCGSLFILSTKAVKLNLHLRKCQDPALQCHGSHMHVYDQECPVTQVSCSIVPHFTGNSVCEQENLHILTRNDWGAREPKKTSPMETPVNYFLIHHSAGWFDHRACDSQSDCIDKVKDIQEEHIDKNKWDDIGYNYLVGGDGSVFEGRGWQHTGSHSPGYNNISIGVCLIGNFESKLPTSSARAALSKLYNCLKRIGKLTASHSVYGHRDVRQTKCPGDEYYPTLAAAFGASWHREDPPEYYTECRLAKGKCQKETETCDGKYHVRKSSWKLWELYLCPEYDTDSQIKCCIPNGS